METIGIGKATFTVFKKDPLPVSNTLYINDDLPELIFNTVSLPETTPLF